VTADAPDPLGRRSLFWATGVGARLPEPGDDTRPLGKHAFYSQAPPGTRRSKISPRTNGKANEPAPPGKATGTRGASRWDRLGLGSSGVLGPVVVDCSSCKVRTEVGVGEFAALHLPFWLWRPGRGYARRMTCPSCGRRAWLSASWRPWER
jgi:hypothetical protein